MGKKKSAATPALKVLVDAQLPHVVHTFEAGADHFGQHAAQALEAEGVAAEAILKTLVIDLTAGKGPKRKLAVACIPVPHSLSLKKAAAAFGVSKASMADPHDASASSGYIPGGISPLGQKRALPTLIDSSAEAFDMVYVSAGKRGMDVGLAPADLAQACQGGFADLCAR